MPQELFGISSRMGAQQQQCAPAAHGFSFSLELEPAGSSTIIGLDVLCSAACDTPVEAQPMQLGGSSSCDHAASSQPSMLDSRSKASRLLTGLAPTDTRGVEEMRAWLSKLEASAAS